MALLTIASETVGQDLSARLPGVHSPREVARAAGVPRTRVLDLIASGELRTIDGTYIAHREAVRIGRILAMGVPATPRDDPSPSSGPLLFQPVRYTRRSAGIPALASTSFHAAVLAAIVFITTVGLSSSEVEEIVDKPSEPIRLVYLQLPGPGGGGGGGGLRQPRPAPRAERKGASRLSSPLPARRAPEPIVPTPAPPEPKPEVLRHEPLPPIVAPIVTAPSDAHDRVGVLEQTQAQAESRGPGAGGGAGTGSGTGLGSGDGPGVGPGTGGGVGGGPYRPGSGIDPPRLLREVRPDYTEEARQRSIEGDVLLEIVVRRDGTVGEVRILRSLGAGLDERAVQAVRQWRFAPARRLGTPVDVIVEVSVEFKLR